MNPTNDLQPVIARLEDFDSQSGTRAERVFFNHRLAVVLVCIFITVVLGWLATGLRLNASFDKTIPTQHPYVASYLANRANLGGQTNVVRIGVENTRGTVLDAHYMAVLQKINDEVFLMPGVERAFMKSLWTSATRWVAVTEDGLEGGTVIPDGYDGSARSLAQLRVNIERSGEIGQLVANDFKSSIILVPLQGVDPKTGRALDYGEFGRQVETMRAKYEREGIRLHITGFAKVTSDLIDGLRSMLVFFGLALLITGTVVFAYTRCLRSTALVVACSLIAVIWQFGLLAALGYELDPYSVLVPFLVFAIGMSHGAQKMNGIMQDIGRGTHRLVAARYTFRRLFMAGLTALLCDAVGFAVLAIIQIKVIQDLAAIASIGVAVLIFTNLVLLPILLSYLGVSASAARRSLAAEAADARQWRWLEQFTRRGPALAAIAVSVLLAAGGYAVSLRLQIGDLDPGAPELRAESRYNRDNAYLVEHYAASADIFTVMVATPEEQCTRYATLAKVDDLAWRLEQLPGVESTKSMAGLSKWASVGYNEGNLKWFELVPNEAALGGVQTRAPRELFNQGCSFLSLFVYLKDHKAQTLTHVVQEVEKFIAEDAADPSRDPGVRFMLAAGSAGIDAATNIVVKDAMREMLFWVYAAVIALCWVTFRSWRAVVVAVLPLMLTSVLCEALMVALGMGVKVATLPVIALGVGIGVDYALYVLSVMLTRMREGDSLAQAYRHALRFTGKVVMLTGITLALAVGTWAFSPIKFQADMGILLAFMFVWNMVGALVLVPALGVFLLRDPQVARTAPASPQLAKA